MKTVKRIFTILLTSVTVLYGLPVPQTAAAEYKNPKERIIVSLGDSFSSGEGIEPFYGQDDIWNKIFEGKIVSENDKSLYYDWLAHRSKRSWSGQLTLPGVNGTMSKHRNNNWFFVAASGAEIKHFGAEIKHINDNGAEVTADEKQNKPYDYRKRYNSAHNIDYIYKKIEKNINLTPKERETIEKYVKIKDRLSGKEQFDYQLSVFDSESVKKGTVDYVTLTISGNDIGFPEIIESANRITGVSDVNQLINLLNNKINLFDNVTSKDLYTAYSKIQNKAGKQAKIIVAGYPKLLNPKGSIFFSSDNSKAINDYTLIFNEKIKSIADDCRENKGIETYFVPVDGDEYFGGHEAYTVDPYINGIIPIRQNDLDDSIFPPVSAYSIHPNEKGAEAYTKAVKEMIYDLELKENGIISGHIYKNRDKQTEEFNQSDYTSNVHISAVNADTGEETYLHDTDENGYYEILVPPGKYKLKVTYKDGTSFFVKKEKNDSVTDEDLTINIKAGDFVKEQDAYEYLEGNYWPFLVKDSKNNETIKAQISISNEEKTWKYNSSSISSWGNLVIGSEYSTGNIPESEYPKDFPRILKNGYSFNVTISAKGYKTKKYKYHIVNGMTCNEFSHVVYLDPEEEETTAATEAIPGQKKDYKDALEEEETIDDESIEDFLDEYWDDYDYGVPLEDTIAWTVHDGHLYALYDYYICAQIMNNIVTQVNNDVHLVTISDKNEQQALEELLAVGGRCLYLTGGIVDKNGSVNWVSGENSDYTNWMEDCPMDYEYDEYQDIVAIWRGFEYDAYDDPDFGEWLEVLEDEWNYICYSDKEMYDVKIGIIIEWDNLQIND